MSIFLLNGIHAGRDIADVPTGYLRWMVRVRHHYWREAEAELKDRGSARPELEVSGSAIDRASNHLLGKWRRTRAEGEGLHSWLIRLSSEAMRFGVKEPIQLVDEDSGSRRRSRRRDGLSVDYARLKLIFAMDHEWPVLITVYQPKGLDFAKKTTE